MSNYKNVSRNNIEPYIKGFKKIEAMPMEIKIDAEERIVRSVKREKFLFNTGLKLFQSNSSHLSRFVAIWICLDAIKRSGKHAYRDYLPICIVESSDEGASMTSREEAVDRMIRIMMPESYYLNDEHLRHARLVFGLDLESTQEDLFYLQDRMRTVPVV